MEVSPFLKKVQMDNLRNFLRKNNIYLTHKVLKNVDKEVRCEILSNDEIGLNITWYTTYESFLSENYENFSIDADKKKKKIQSQDPKHELFDIRPVIILCNEFFDALPISIFEYTKYGWCEKLVSTNKLLDGFGNKQSKFQWELSDPNIESVKKILNPRKIFKDQHILNQVEIGDTIEVSPKSMVMINNFAELLSKVGGGMLAIDYGDTHAFSNSLRVIY